MTTPKGATRSRDAWRLARAQHGVVARRQLLGLGFTRAGIKHRIASGRLHPVVPGIYSVGRAGVSPEGRWMAAVLACGPGAALTHRSAAALWGIGEERANVVEVTVRHRGRRHRPGIRCRNRPSLPLADITRHRGIPVTTPARTLVDLAAVATESRLERAVNEADVLDLIDPETLLAALPTFSGSPGLGPLRALLDPLTFRLSDRELEVRFRPLSLAAGLPQPETKVWVNGHEVDFLWPELRLVVETDGLRYHRTELSQRRDLVRDQAHTAAGFTRLRFSHWQVRHEPDHVKRILAATYDILRH